MRRTAPAQSPPTRNLWWDLAEKNRMRCGRPTLDRVLDRMLRLRIPFSGDTDGVSAEYAELLDVNGTGMMGYIRIPKIDVELPIYHGTSEPVLQVGAGHISTTSLPVGGASTHAVLTGHRGLPSKRLFHGSRYRLRKGDIFYLKVLNETLAYKVDQILTVLPHETEALQIAEGEDYVTLVTCTPYGVNTHRLLIRGTGSRMWKQWRRCRMRSITV